MKTVFLSIFLIFMIITQAHASFLGGMLLGAALSSSSKKTIVNETDQTKLINAMNNSIPLSKENTRKEFLNFSFNNSPSIDHDFWNRFNRPSISFSLAGYNETAIKSYYQNLGYNVRLNNHNLIFDFQPQYEMYLKHKKVIPASAKISMLLIGFILLLIIIPKTQYYFYKKKIFTYMKNTKELYFWDKNDELTWNRNKNNGDLPLNWIFKFNENTKQISGISYYSGYAMGIIATEKVVLPNFLTKVMKEKLEKNN